MNSTEDSNTKSPGAMIAERVIPALATAATFVGAGFLVIAQAIFDPFAGTVEQLVGGGALLVAAGLIVRWTFKLMDKVESVAEADREAWLAREKMLLDQLARSNEQLAEVNTLLTAERQLRLSLEHMGIKDRRGDG